MQTRAQRKRERDRDRFTKQFLSREFKKFHRDSPCVRCGRGPCRAHHDPTVAVGATWRDTSPLCDDCHTLGPGARHRVGVATFWSGVGISFEESNAKTLERWTGGETL